MSLVGDKEAARLRLHQTQGSKGINRARVMGLLLMAASCLVSLHLISIFADHSELFFKSTYFLIGHSGG